MIGVYIPGGEAQQTIDNIKQAESKGVPSFWLTSGGVAADSIMIFATAAVQNSRIKMGTSITQTWPRHPVAAYGSDEQIAARLGEVISQGAGEVIAHQLPVSQDGLAEQTEHFLEVVARANKLAGVAS